MISSQTFALPDDPPAIQLPAAALDQYAGTYRVGPKRVVKIVRQGDGLAGATNEGEAHPLFERNAAGAITGFNTRREGHDLHCKRDA